MINPNGEGSTQKDPLPGSVKPGGQSISPGSSMSSTAPASQSASRFQDTTEKVSTVAGDAWRQTKATANTAREKTEFLLRQNPVPTVIGALAVGLAIGLAIRYSSESAEREREVKSPFGDVNLGVLSLPFLWPFFKSVQRKYEDSADVVKDGVDRLKSVDVDRYVKPLRKKWRSWRN
ncbi:MAG TPA: hypothetical protein VK474_10900 [Chthoniobacterales bacterium]|nr:hypothetical protein [Chthoniobacterales bacterium]